MTLFVLQGSGSLHASLEEARLANKILADDKRELQTSLSHMHTTVKVRITVWGFTSDLVINVCPIKSLKMPK